MPSFEINTIILTELLKAGYSNLTFYNQDGKITISTEYSSNPGDPNYEPHMAGSYDIFEGVSIESLLYSALSLLGDNYNIPVTTEESEYKPVELEKDKHIPFNPGHHNS